MRHPFRRRNAQALYDLHYGPNMTPMVDVVMVILIFFMASAVVLGPQWFLKSSLARRGPGAPAAPDAEQPTRLRIVLRHAQAGTLATIDGAGRAVETDLAGVRAELASLSLLHTPERLVVLVSPGDDVPYADVVRVHEQCAELGISRVGLLEPEKP